MMRSDQPVEWDEDTDSLSERLMIALDVCGCSERAPLFRLIRAVLTACDRQEWAEIRTAILPDSAHYYAVLNWLDRLDLLEHGSGIRCSWPTTRGKDVLAKLNEWHAAGEPED